jgi:hypothetical protein
VPSLHLEPVSHPHPFLLPTPTPEAVSDMANGGQVLVDSVTFDGIRDHRDLAAVDHHGYNDTLLLQAAGALHPLSCGSCK